MMRWSEVLAAASAAFVGEQIGVKAVHRDVIEIDAFG
jgi:hypothetical protein